ncbi:MAG TPA: M28 family peptidase, partial [Terrimicrobiaceae bacterium]
DNGEAQGEIVFVGYGLVAPEEHGARRYDSYDGVDAKDKIVLVLRYAPEEVEQGRRAHLNRYAGLRYKAMLARSHGARAVLFVSGPNSPHAGELTPLSGDGSLSGSDIIAVSISGAVADSLLKPTGKSLKDLQTALDTENPHADQGFVVPNLRVKMNVGLERVSRTDRNVLVTIPPIGSDEWIIVGAHYDHLGHGGGGNSLANAGEQGMIHPGADDNASGTAVVMEIASSLVRQSTADPVTSRRGILFALWSGEEIGMLGSAAFLANPPVPADKIAAYVNFDMVGRLRDNRLILQGAGSSSDWRKLIEKRNVAAGFNLSIQDDPYLPTDVTSFYQRKIPVLNFFTRAHEDYHRPTDTAEKLDYAGLERIGRFARQIVNDLASAPERPAYVKVERSSQSAGSRENLRAYLGTIPDYTTDAKGVKISGTRGGSPAEKAGLLGGDVIVEFAGQKIANIYDYTYALDAVKIGEKTKMVVERNGELVTLAVIPEVRK